MPHWRGKCYRGVWRHAGILMVVWPEIAAAQTPSGRCTGAPSCEYSPGSTPEHRRSPGQAAVVHAERCGIVAQVPCDG